MEPSKPRLSAEEEVQRLLRARKQAEGQNDPAAQIDTTADQAHEQTDSAASSARTLVEQGRQAANQAADQVQGVIGRTQQATHDRIEHAREHGHAAADSNGSGAGIDDVKEQVQEKTAQVQEKAREMGDQMNTRADEVMTTSGERLNTLSQTLRERAPEGTAGDIAQRSADALEQSGTYLQLATPGDVRQDLERTIRANPIETLLVGVGVGFLLARLTRRS